MTTKRDDWRLARRMMKAHRPMSEIIAILGNKYTEERILAGVKTLSYHRAYDGYFGRRVAGIAGLKEPIIPASVLMERARRKALCERAQSLTAAICNDPPFELSALAAYMARQHTEQHAIARDPLDGLIFGFGRSRR